MTFAELMSMFLLSRQRGTDGARAKARPRTIEAYEYALNHFINFMESERSVSGYTQMKKADLLAYFDRLEGRSSSETSTRPLSKASRSLILRSLRTFFRWVDMDEECNELELMGWRRWKSAFPVIEKSPRRTFIPSERQLKEFKNSFNLKSPWGYRDYVACSLMLDTGMRVGEVCNLRVGMVNLEQKVLFSEGKTGPMKVRITDTMARLLQGWLRRRKNCRMAAESEHVFVTKYAPKCTPNTFQQKFRKHRKKHGLAPITPHTNRHAFCTYYLKNGGTIARLKNMTGHKDYRMLLEYEHLAEVAGDEAKEELERVSPLKAVDKAK